MFYSMFQTKKGRDILFLFGQFFWMNFISYRQNLL